MVRNPEADRGELSARAQRWLLLVLAIELGLLTAWLGYRRVRENVHELAGGRAWRSGQPDAAMLQRLAAHHGIRSVLNLRGANQQRDWYQIELAAAQTLGLKHYDVTLDSNNAPTSGELKELLRIFDECPRPLLIHCESGSDRTGMVAVIYELSQEDVTLERAERELSLLYGHFPWRKGTGRFKAFLRGYKDWLQAQGVEHDRQRFRAWAATTYVRPVELGGPDIPVYPPWKLWENEAGGNEGPGRLAGGP